MSDTFRDEVRDEMQSSRYHGANHKRRAAILSLIDLYGMADDIAGDVDLMGYYARVGRSILQIDSQGFADAYIHETIGNAKVVMEGLHNIEAM